MRHPSRNSSGGRNSRKKISGSSVTRQSAARPITAPSAIWKGGRGRGSGTTRDRMQLRMTASSSRRMIDMVSKAQAAPSKMNSAFKQSEDAIIARRLGRPTIKMGEYRKAQKD